VFYRGLFAWLVSKSLYHLHLFQTSQAFASP
jgi:hypothetical protein